MVNNIMRRNGLRTDDKRRSAARSLQVRGGGLGQRVSQPVRPPISGGEMRAVRFLGFTTGLVDWCAGIHKRLPLVTQMEMSSPTLCATPFQILARVLEW